VRFNNDLAVQGYISLTLDTYAYQYGGNTTNNYTGRWGYSFPMSALAGGSTIAFGATGGVALTATMPRAVGGYTFLLYAADIYPKMIPNQAGFNFQSSNGMFPSQSTVANTLRDPFDIYSEYAHFPMNAVQYTENAVQPSYGGSNPYADQSAVEVAAISVKSTSSPNVPQNLQPAFDFQVLAMGYRGTNSGGTQAQNYTLQF